MRKLITTTVSIFLCASMFGQIWTKEANSSGLGRDGAGTFTIGNYGYLGCGWNNGGTQYKDFYRWNQANNTWSAIANYPGAGASSGISFAIEGKGYEGLGYGSGVTKDLWRYDSTSNAWTAMTSLPGSGRYGQSVFVLGHKAYLVAGSAGGPPYLNDVWVYDAHANTWKQLSNFPGGNLSGVMCFSIGNKGYAVGGWDGTTSHTAGWSYDSTNDTWTAIASTPVAIGGAPAAFVIGSKAYVSSGATPGNNTPLKLGYVYDTVTKAWTVFSDLRPLTGLGRCYGSCFTIGNYGYMAAGDDTTGNVTTSFWQYYYDTAYTLNGITVLSQPKCNGDVTGSAFINALGGVTPYTYSWSTVPIQTTATATGLSAGSYTVTVNDFSGRSLTASTTVTQPSQLRDSIASSTNNSATVGVKGGTTPYTYSWAPTGQTTVTAINLTNGTYSVTVRDANGCSVTASIAITNSCDTWAKIANSPGAGRDGAGTFTIGNYGYMGCGWNNGGTQYKDFYRWNQVNNTWSAIANYPGAGAAAGISFAIEGKGYEGLGYGSGVTKDLWRYDSTSNAWTQVASLPGSGRYNQSVFVLGHKAYLVAGSAGGPPYLNDVWVYDAHANTWKQLNNFPGGDLAGVMCFSIGNKGYAVGGWDGTTAHSAAWSYDSTNDTWTAIASTPVAIAGSPEAFVIGSKAYVSNGSTPGNTTPLKLGYVYDTVTKGWTVFSDLRPLTGLGRCYGSCFTIGNHGYMGVGDDTTGNVTTSFWQYYPCSDTVFAINDIQLASPVCTGDLGSATANVSGGITPYTYSWSTAPIQTTATATGLSIGSYTVTVNDFSGRSLTASVTMTQPTQLRDSIASVTLNSATVGVKGGVAPYVYTWAPAGQATATASILSNGTYTVTVRDANGCSVTASTVISNSCDTWSKMASYPAVGRDGAGSFTIGNYGYLGCGWNNGGTRYKDFYRWNQANNTWSAIANYPGAGGAAGISFSIEGKGYEGLGYGSVVTKDLWRYDSTSNAWTQMASLPGTARYNQSVFVLGHKAYLVTGSPGGQPYLNDVWVYDAHANSWKQLNNFPGGDLSGVMCFAIGNKGYAVGGWDGTSAHSAGWSYDSTNDTWTAIASIPIAMVGSPTAFVIGSKAYVSNGATPVNNDPLNVGYVYDTTTKGWSIFSDIRPLAGLGRAFGNSFNIGNYGYTAAGDDTTGNVTTSFWQYYPCPDTAYTLDGIWVNSSPKCNGDLTGSATVSVSGGRTPYTYSWNTTPTQTTATATGLSAGIYKVAVMDSTGREFTDSVLVNQPAALSASIISSTSTSATVGVTGGTAPYTYLWSPGGQTTAAATGLVGGNYTVTIKDANGCLTTDSASISTLDSVHICIVSVDTSSLHNIIVWNNSSWINIDSVKIYFYNSASQWQLLGEVLASAGQFIDSSSINSPNRNTVRYVITGVDSKGNQEPISASLWHNTLFININKSTGTFSWSGTGYLIEGDPLPVVTYVLYRDNVGNGHWIPIDSVSGTQNTMTDPAYASYPNARWYVEARLNVSGCATPNGRVESGGLVGSRSNQEGNVVLGVLQVSNDQEAVSIYPNPVNQTLNIRFKQNESVMNIKISDVTGRVIIETNNVAAHDNTSSINVSALSAGVYFIGISNSGYEQTIKFIKE